MFKSTVYKRVVVSSFFLSGEHKRKRKKSEMVSLCVCATTYKHTHMTTTTSTQQLFSAILLLPVLV